MRNQGLDYIVRDFKGKNQPEFKSEAILKKWQELD